MPCRTDEPTPQEQRRLYEEAFTHDSHVAEMLCAVLSSAEIRGTTKEVLWNLTNPIMASKVEAWWHEHKKRDKKRIEAELKEVKKERDKLAALGKLTPYERNLLGLG